MSCNTTVSVKPLLLTEYSCRSLEVPQCYHYISSERMDYFMGGLSFFRLLCCEIYCTLLVVFAIGLSLEITRNVSVICLPYVTHLLHALKQMFTKVNHKIPAWHRHT